MHDVWLTAALSAPGLSASVAGARLCWREVPDAHADQDGSGPASALAAFQADMSVVIVAGLVLGALGDFLLSRPGTTAFVAGMAVFGLGLSGLASVAAAPDRLAPYPWIAVAVPLLALSTERWLAPHTGALRWPVRGYVGADRRDGCVRVHPSPESWPTIGVGLSLPSDLLLSVERFVLKADAHRALVARGLGKLLVRSGADRAWLGRLTRPGRCPRSRPGAKQQVLRGLVL
ncbi:MAG: lysoplasmalogenase family protein [Paracoccaceae bacterium]